jgi:hypothetical protein
LPEVRAKLPSASADSRSGSRASSSGTTEVRCNSLTILPEYSASRTSLRLRVLSTKRSVSHLFETSTTPTANRTSRKTISFPARAGLPQDRRYRWIGRQT